MKKRIVPYNELEEKVALALTRVSTSRQEYQGSSLETQEDEIVRYAVKNAVKNNVNQFHIFVQDGTESYIDDVILYGALF